jgi:hypothetical protein
MKTPEKERLLHEVLCDESYAAFRQALYQRTRAELRHQGWANRRYSLLALAASVALLISWGAWQLLRPPIVKQGAPVLTIVRSVPLAPGQLVTTLGPHSSSAGSQSSIITFVTRVGAIEVIHTAPFQFMAEKISDAQLVDLFKGHALVLAPKDHAGKQLVFLDPNDQAEFYGSEP